MCICKLKLPHSNILKMSLDDQTDVKHFSYQSSEQVVQLWQVTFLSCLPFVSINSSSSGFIPTYLQVITTYEKN